jgi:hypothetical protein
VWSFVPSISRAIGGGSFTLYLHELGALVFIVRKNVQSHGLAQFKLVWTIRLAGTKQPLPFRRTGDILNVGAIAISQSALFYEVVSLAVWTFDI